MNTTIEPEKVPHIHQWFGTGEMERGEMRCISCGMWGKAYDEQAERIAELEAENRKLFTACQAIVEWCDRHEPIGNALYCVQMCRDAVQKEKS